MAAQTHQRAIFLASFVTLIAAGMGFAIRGDVLAEWGAQFGFTKTQLGEITGSGLYGFCITIILGSLIADRVGYKPLMILAFLLHASSAIVTLMAGSAYEAANNDPQAAYNCLYWGQLLFALGNGMCEAVINPLVATLYPRQKTHYLNILHAGWPGGLILGGLLSWVFVGEHAIYRLRWEIPMGFFLVPTLWYGLVAVKERFPVSEARAAGVEFGDMLKQFAAPMLLFLLFLHACVGYVELGTDSWITDIMKPVIPNSVLLLVYTSAIMFVLRFFAGPIVERINPLGLLFVSALLGVAGLLMLGSPTNVTAWGIIGAATIYGFGKTFLWPTMLGVVGERFPKGGALTMGAIGGVGMLSAGLLGGPGIGYKQDYFAKEKLESDASAVYQQFRAEKPKGFLFFPEIAGLDGTKVDAIKEKVDAEAKETKKSVAEVRAQLPESEQQVLAAGEYGGRRALQYTAAVPATMAVGYLLLIFYFMSQGGYRAVELDSSGHEHESARKPSAADAIYRDSNADQA